MLPAVVGDARAARAIFASAVLLVLASIVPVWYGLSWLYLIGALGGGAYFLRRSALLVRDPGPRTAMANFHASLIQLTVLLVAAIVDATLLG
jgi:protoheme IX farnesyltransferase